MEICLTHKEIDMVMVLTDYSSNPGCAAKINCLPEDSYPAEDAEVEVEAGYLYIDGDESIGSITPSTVIKNTYLFDTVYKANESRIYQAVIDDMTESAADYEAQEAEYREEQLWGDC